MGGSNANTPLGVAKEEVDNATAIHHRWAQAASSRADKAKALPGNRANGFGCFERNTQAQEEVMSVDSQKSLAAQEVAYDTKCSPPALRPQRGGWYVDLYSSDLRQP